MQWEDFWGFPENPPPWVTFPQKVTSTPRLHFVSQQKLALDVFTSALCFISSPCHRAAHRPRAASGSERPVPVGRGHRPGPGPGPPAPVPTSCALTLHPPSPTPTEAWPCPPLPFPWSPAQVSHPLSRAWSLQNILRDCKRLPRKPQSSQEGDLQFGPLGLLDLLIESLKLKIACFHLELRRGPSCLLPPRVQGQLSMGSPPAQPTLPSASLHPQHRHPQQLSVPGPLPRLPPWAWKHPELTAGPWPLIPSSVTRPALAPPAAYSLAPGPPFLLLTFFVSISSSGKQSKGQRPKRTVKIITIRRRDRLPRVSGPYITPRTPENPSPLVSKTLVIWVTSALTF